jgi:hypothetical protein
MNPCEGVHLPTSHPENAPVLFWEQCLVIAAQNLRTANILVKGRRADLDGVKNLPNR